ARSHELRDLLARVALPHGFYQPDSEAGRALLEQAGQDGTILPVLVFRSGLALADPSDAQIAEMLGFHSRAQGPAYDVAVVGGGHSAGQAAVHLAKWAAGVTLLVRGGGLAATMSDYLVKEVEALPNVAVRPRTQVVAGHGHGRLEALTLADDRDGSTRTVPA